MGTESGALIYRVVLALCIRRMQVVVGQHPYIVKLFSYWATDARLYFLMEYVDVSSVSAQSSPCVC